MKPTTLRQQIETALQKRFPFSRFVVTGERKRPNVFHVEVNPPDVDSLTASVKPAATYARVATRLFGGKFMDASQYRADWREGQPLIGAWFTLITPDNPIVIEEPPFGEQDTKPDVGVYPVEVPADEPKEDSVQAA